jgi:hypothetical protein
MSICGVFRAVSRAFNILDAPDALTANPTELLAVMAGAMANV